MATDTESRYNKNIEFMKMHEVIYEEKDLQENWINRFSYFLHDKGIR